MLSLLLLKVALLPWQLLNHLGVFKETQMLLILAHLQSI